MIKESIRKGEYLIMPNWLLAVLTSIGGSILTLTITAIFKNYYCHC